MCSSTIFQDSILFMTSVRDALTILFSIFLLLMIGNNGGSTLLGIVHL
jgi:hypothetical protein